MLRRVRQSLLQFGSFVPPTVNWAAVRKECPSCEKLKLVIPESGIRISRGLVRPISWCVKCRSETNYHEKPRKNRVKNPSGRRR